MSGVQHGASEVKNPLANSGDIRDTGTGNYKRLET